MRSMALVGIALCALWPDSATQAAALKAATVACKAPKDATKVVEFLIKKDTAGLEAFSRPLIASGACTAMGRGLTVTVDEKKPPLSSVRLSGDLDCYWVTDVFVDLYPSDKTGTPNSTPNSKRGGQHY